MNCQVGIHIFSLESRERGKLRKRIVTVIFLDEVLVDVAVRVLDLKVPNIERQKLLQIRDNDSFQLKQIVRGSYS